MSPNREEILFQLALEKPAAERGALLEVVCGGDAALRARIEALLAAHEQTKDVLPEPKPGGQPAQTMKLEFADAPDEATGQKIGRYKILEKVGEGGCGVVYVAEQTEPVRRRVALKVIKLGMDTKQVVARFEAERQALAMMDHPNIAKVLDAGSTKTGRPYFIMELVRGIRITDYCDQEKVPTRERLDLFIQICQAIQHAHQKGIIHRDIKPSNILVTLHDGVPVPKVIDFGIAKATEGKLTDATVYTQLHQFIGTPAYMSPEQAEMSGLDIDTRSDIYSLGVLLYELLTGKTPFDAQELMSQGIDAMRKTIREKDPVRPSTKLATLQGEELTTTARRRSVDHSKLLHQLKGDLDWIVMKCLEKDRKRRYETANGLAMDLKRHLNNDTVAARPPSKVYEFQKMVRRHKAGFVATAAIVVVLAIGIVMTTWQAVRATRAMEMAQTESARNTQTAQFLLDMLDSARTLGRQGRDTTLLREMMDQAEARMSRDLADNPAVEVRLRGNLGWTYYCLGEYTRAEDSFKRSVELCRKGMEKDTPDHEVEKALGAVVHFLGLTLWHEGKLPEAESCLRESLAINRKLFGDDSKEAADPLADLALVLLTQGKYAEAEAMFRETLAVRQKLLGDTNANVGWSLSGLGNTLAAEGRLAEAESSIGKAQVIFEKLEGPKSPDLALMLMMLGHALQQEGRLTEAEGTFRKGLAMQKELLPRNHADTLLSMVYLAGVLEKQGKLDEAAALYRQAADAGKGSAQAGLGQLYASGRGVSKDMAEAGKWYRQAIERIRPDADNGDAVSMIELAHLLATCEVAEFRDGPRAVSYAEKVVAVTGRKSPDALDALAAAYAETLQFDKAIATQKEAIAALTTEQDKRPFESRLKLYEARTPCRDSEAFYGNNHSNQP